MRETTVLPSEQTMLVTTSITTPLRQLKATRSPTKLVPLKDKGCSVSGNSVTGSRGRSLPVRPTPVMVRFPLPKRSVTPILTTSPLTFRTPILVPSLTGLTRLKPRVTTRQVCLIRGRCFTKVGKELSSKILVLSLKFLLETLPIKTGKSFLEPSRRSSLIIPIPFRSPSRSTGKTVSPNQPPS